MSKRIALIVGIDQYNCKEIVGLQGAIRDARQFSAYLEYGLPAGERFEVVFLSNPTHERVVTALEEIRQAVQGEEDVVFALYFSGHGKRFHDGTSQLLLCSDATRTTLLGRTTAGAITPEELAYYRDEIPGHKFFCFDSCRSQLDRAHGDDLDENGTSLFRDVVCRRSEAAQAKFYCHWSLSSCADRERASDDGAFMNAMLETMKSSMDACGRILLDDSFVRAIADRIHAVNPDSYQHPVGGGNSFCLCGTEDSASGESTRSAGALKTLTLKGIEWRFRWSPAGTFMMGSSKLGWWVLSNEKLHHVTLTRGFWMQETTVTQEMWTSFMGSNPSYFAKGGKYPVEQVSWNDVQEFIKKLNSNSGYRFRLPTEAEWEYACRAGQNYKYSGSDDLDRVGWYGGNSDFHTHEVGQKQANGWGLYDMSGNVWEWVQDWYGGCPSGTATDPQGPSSGSYRVIRGGSWDDSDYYCRCSYRYCSSPGYSGYDLGFRLLLESDD